MNWPRRSISCINRGKVRYFGVSNVNPMQIELLQSAISQKLHVNQLQFGLGHADMIRQEFHVNMSDAASIDMTAAHWRTPGSSI